MIKQYSDSAQNQSSKIKKTIFYTLLLTLICGIAIIWLNKNSQATESKALLHPFIESSQKSQTSTQLNSQAVTKVDKDKLDKKINQILQENIPSGKSWIFGVYVSDLETEEAYTKNEKEQFDAASVGKLPILMTLYNQIKEGKVKEEEQITITDKDIQDYGTGTIRYQKTPITYTVQELAELMIKKSDNTAAKVLADKAGRDNIKKYVESLGMKDTDVSENTTTPYDIDILLKNIYSLKKTDPILSGKLISIMTNSDFEKRLPRLLPKEAIVAHKIGTGIAQLHDAGIVLLDKRPYTVSIFSKKINDEDKAEEIIGLISKTVYDEYQSIQ